MHSSSGQLRIPNEDCTQRSVCCAPWVTTPRPSIASSSPRKYLSEARAGANRTGHPVRRRARTKCSDLAVHLRSSSPEPSSRTSKTAFGSAAARCPADWPPSASSINQLLSTLTKDQRSQVQSALAETQAGTRAASGLRCLRFRGPSPASETIRFFCGSERVSRARGASSRVDKRTCSPG